jgi:hypothetical protein
MNNGMRAALLAAIALATLLLGTCSDTNLVALLTNEVKRANNKFLVLKSVEPANSATNVDPGAPIRIVFDRALDVATLDQTNITVTPNVGMTFDFQFNDLTNTLSILVDPFLDNSTDYTLTVTKGVLATDGSELESQFAWSFRTGIYPAGNLSINAGATYTNSTTVTLNLTANAVVWKYRAAKAEAELAAQTWVILDLSPTIALDAGDGTKTVYVQFLDTTLNESTVRSDTIILDTVLPVITVYSPTIYQNLTTTATPSIAASDDRSGVDTTTYLWANGGNPVTITPANVQAPSVAVTGSEKVPYPVTVTVKDLAGNTSAPATVNVYKDTIPPDAAPLVTATTPSPAFTPAPRWSWTAMSTLGTGEAPPQFKYEIRNSANVLFYALSSTALNYNTRPAIKWPDYSRGAPPDTYTIYVWERDLAGNTSTTAGTSAVVVTSVLPVDRAKNVSLTPTLQWWTMAGPKDPSQAPEYYVLHYGYLDKAGRLIEYRPIEVVQPKGTDPSQLLPILDLGMTYLWYVEVPLFGLRSPAAKDQYWSFTTTTKG